MDNNSLYGNQGGTQPGQGNMQLSQGNGNIQVAPVDGISGQGGAPIGKPEKRIGRVVAGIVAGLAVVAVGIFGFIKLTEKPGGNECADCDSGKSEISKRTGDIDYDFLRLESPKDNIIYSPLSIRYGLSLLDVGANRKTKTEIDKVLGKATVPKYKNIPGTLSLANAAFIRNTFKDKVLPSFAEAVQNDFDGEVIYDSFDSSANMDKWVQKKTFGLIDGIGVEPTDDLEMVLANALAIQMDWKQQFDTGDTSGRAFYKKDGFEIKATTMSQETSSEDVKYFKDDTMTALSMPLDSTMDDVDLNFVAIMPSDDIDEYIKNVDQSKIDAVLGNLMPASKPQSGIAINIPKFKFEYQLDFKQDLESLGIKRAFNRTEADFSRIVPDDSLYVGDAIHKANIDFSEDGIKAAAVTAFLMESNAMMKDESRPIDVNIDHPFLFFIRDAKNNTVWFTGVVYQPNLWADDREEYQLEY